MDAFHISGLQISSQAVLDVVGDLDRFLLGGKTDDRKHRAEHFALRQFAGGIDVRENCRLDVETVGQLPANSTAAHDQLAHPLGASALDHAQNARHSRLVDDRAHVSRRIERIPDLDRTSLCYYSLQDLFVDVAMNQHAGRKTAALAAHPHDAQLHSV